MIKINGTTIPTPSSYDWNIMDLSKAERNASGTIIIERITTKRKLLLRYNYLTKAQLSDLMLIISDVFFTVEYPDAKTATLISGIFYVGDRSASMIDYKNNQPRYRDVNFNLIER